MGRIAAALAVTALLLTACGDDDDTAADDPSETTEVDETTTTTEAERTTTTTEPGDRELTADRPAAEVLAEAGLLRDGAALVGATAPEDRAVQAALCDHVFGDVETVTELAGLPGEVALEGESGYLNLPGEGDGLWCVYTVDGVEALGVLLWNNEIEDEADDGTRIVAAMVTADGHHGAVAHAPEYDGPTMDEQTALDWLAEASPRWLGASV